DSTPGWDCSRCTCPRRRPGTGIRDGGNPPATTTRPGLPVSTPPPTARPRPGRRPQVGPAPPGETTIPPGAWPAHQNEMVAYWFLPPLPRCLRLLSEQAPGSSAVVQ